MYIHIYIHVYQFTSFEETDFKTNQRHQILEFKILYKTFNVTCRITNSAA